MPPAPVDPTVAVADIRRALPVAHALIYDRIPSPAPDRVRVSGVAGVRVASDGDDSRDRGVPAPQIDEAVAELYLYAQRALRHVYHQLVDAGAPRFWRRDTGWRGDPDHPIEVIVDWRVLDDVAARVVGLAGLLDDDSASQLTAARRRLAPFWLPADQRRLPAGCTNCRGTHNRQGPECGPCYVYRRRNARPRPQHLWRNT